MERLVYKQLIHWKCAKGRKPLVFNGARQVGKTWLLKELAQREYAKMAYVMCRKNPVVKYKEQESMTNIPLYAV